GRRFSLLDQARAWEVILSEEFGVPFAFYPAAPDADAAGSQAGPRPVWEPDGGRPGPLDWETLGRLLADGQARGLPRDGRHYPGALLLYEGGRPALVAAGDLPALATGPAAAREQARLQKWAQSVGDRLRLADQFSCQRHGEEEQSQQTVRCWEALLTLNH